MTYVLLIYRSAAPGALPPAADKAGLARHRALQREAGDDLRSVAQLAEPRRARMVRARGGSHEVTDGPFLETKEWLVGFYLVDCDDEAQAIARAAQLADDAHAIEVRPAVWTR
jgi:hypothetical protein